MQIFSQIQKLIKLAQTDTNNSFIKILQSATTFLIFFTVLSFTPIFNFAVKRYIHNHPKEIISALQKMEQTQRSEQEKAASENAVKIFNELSTNLTVPFLGAKDGKNTIIQYFDYNCGYCKKIALELKQVIEKRSDVKVIMQDLPILSVHSLNAAKIGLHIFEKNPSKYQDYYFKLVAKQEIKTDMLKDFAKSYGISSGEFENILKDNAIDTKIKKIYHSASDLKIDGTPVLIINGKLIMGFLGAQQILDAIDLQK